MSIRQSSITLTVGADGTASGKTRTVDGVIDRVHVNYSDGFDASNVVTFQEAGMSPGVTILTLTNVTTDGWYPVRDTLVDRTGTPIVGPVDYLSITDEVQVSVSGAAENDVLIATVRWDDQRR